MAAAMMRAARVQSVRRGPEPGCVCGPRARRAGVAAAPAAARAGTLERAPPAPAAPASELPARWPATELEDAQFLRELGERAQALLPAPAVLERQLAGRSTSTSGGGGPRLTPRARRPRRQPGARGAALQRRGGSASTLGSDFPPAPSPEGLATLEDDARLCNAIKVGRCWSLVQVVKGVSETPQP